MRDEKESWKGFTKEVTFELSFKKDEQVFSYLKAKGRKRITLAKVGVKEFWVFKKTASGLVEMEVTVNKGGGGG